MADSYLARHRGSITGIAASGPRVIYVTRHPEQHATSLNVFDFETRKTTQTSLPASADALALDGKRAYVACSDGTIYAVMPGEPPAPFASAKDVRAIVPVSDGVAIAAGSEVILNDNAGNEIARWDLEESVSALGASPDGTWLTAGTRRGKVTVFHRDEEWSESQSERLHDGEVTALAFPPDELRVYSAGSDTRILISYVRGSFDTEDRGGKNSHEGPIRALIHGPDFSTAEGTHPRFFTAADDSSIKSWPRGRSGSKRPSTLTDGVVQTTDLAIVELAGKPHLVAAGRDATLRLFSFDEEGRVVERLATVYDLYDRAERLLEDDRPERRRSAFESLAKAADARAVELLAEHLREMEEDHKLSVEGVRILSEIDHKDVADELETFFWADASEVRTTAFDGLLVVRGADDRETWDAALEAGFDDLGLRAIAAAKATGGDEAIDVLKEALDNGNQNVRVAALQALESLFGDEPQGTLIGLDSGVEETRRRALVHLHRRGFLQLSKVAARIRRAFDDPDERVRRMAFYISTLRRPSLVKALRRDDPDYHRQIFEIEEFGKPEKERRSEVPERPVINLSRLSDEDVRPLLEATASRSIDVATLGARSLAVLGDDRALGTLLQLSREPSAAARANAAIALQVLDDPRAVRRVRRMLQDGEKQVRDCAFSALERLQVDEPLETVSAGLAAAAIDVRQRALALLAKTLKESDAAPVGEFEGRDLLVKALNDADATLRLEAFKNALNMGVDGGGAESLRFIRRSTHADVRMQTLEEAKAHPKDGDYKTYLLELLDDGDRAIWGDALDFALDRWPKDQHGRIWRAALSARTVPARIHAIEELSRQRDSALRGLLSIPLEDEKPEVRLAAVRGLVATEMRDILSVALTSNFEDVRVEAAAALASLGDERALEGLLQILTDYRERVVRGTKPEELEDRVVSALGGIGDLGHARALDDVIRLVEVVEAPSVANAAAQTIPWLTRPQTLDAIRPLMQHGDSNVVTQTALALAYHGDDSVDSHIFGKLGAATELIAAFALRDRAPDRFLSYVDGAGAVAEHALSIVLLLELSEHDGIPERCVSLLSADDPRVRLKAGQAIEHFGDRPGFYAWVYEAVNDLSKTGDKHDVPAKTLLSLSRAMVHGGPLVAVRAAQLVGTLQRSDGEAFDAGWAVFSDRLSDELERLDRRANKPSEDEPTASGLASAWARLKERARDLVTGASTLEEALASLAFGAYVGLTRETGGRDPHLVRAAAVTGLMRLTKEFDRYRSDVANILMVALGDPAMNVRARAFDGLLELEASHDDISTEALSTGFGDMGLRGLELLAASGGGDELLEQTLLESTNGLEEQAAKLLTDRVGERAMFELGVRAASEALRRRSIQGLAKAYGSDERAEAALRGALDSRHRDVRLAAALELANRKDGAAFSTLVSFIDTDAYGEQVDLARAFIELGDERAIEPILDHLETAEDDSAVERFLEVVVALGDPERAARLIDWIDRDIHRSQAASAALRVSGYRQYEWVDDDDVTKEWEASLKPRYPAFYAELFDLAYRIADAELLGELVGFAKWPDPSGSIDQTLGALLRFSDDNVRHRAVEIAGWRLSHREGPHRGLIEVLNAGDPLDQFYAAEGLALAGHPEGLPVLQTAVDVMDDWTLQQRAVLALGRLAEPSTVDMLLELAADDQHFLQGTAAEAIGHLSKSDRADEIFALLRDLASGGAGAQGESFKGLRWFGTPAAWGVLRRQAKHEHWWIAQQAVDLLRHDPESRDILAEILLETDDWDIAESAANGLRHLDGPDSLEPDYLIVQAKMSEFDASEETVERLRDKGDVGRILAVLPKIEDDNRSIYYEPLVSALLSRRPLPVAEAAPMLDSDNGRTASVAARIVGRAGTDASAQAEQLVAATQKARHDWGEAYQEMLANRTGARERLADVTLRYRWLVWACGQLQTGQDELVAAVELPDDATARPMRDAAMAYMGEPWFGESGVELLVDKARRGDVRTRAQAASELERAAPERAAALLDDVARDDVAVGRLTRGADPDDARAPLRRAVADPVTAGIALPQLAALGDTEGLVAAMRDADLDERTRKGAIDALASIPDASVVELLASFGADEAHDESLRKAAWRARRRASRR